MLPRLATSTYAVAFLRRHLFCFLVSLVAKSVVSSVLNHELSVNKPKRVGCNVDDSCDDRGCIVNRVPRDVGHLRSFM